MTKTDHDRFGIIHDTLATVEPWRAIPAFEDLDTLQRSHASLLGSLRDAIELFGRGETDPDSWEIEAQRLVDKAQGKA
jgi:hypothetical protein